MNVRSQVAMMFHLDKCIGCHTCSIACKNIWTDRKGTDYMWWNNVETKPGTGFPTRWEDQEKYKGGWEKKDGEPVHLKSTGKLKVIGNIFHHPHMPSMDDYYEPWTYDYQNLFNAPEGADQPTARPISMVTGDHVAVEAGPNWDDDLGGSPIYANNDPNFKGMTEEQKMQLFSVEQLVFFYFPRICNHCLNPSCVGSCPSGALYKRGEDGIVLVDQKRCRAWRSCISACPYKKVYFNWFTGKSEKCILCYPRLETGQAPACFHSCVGRIRYLGNVLYDADRIEEVANMQDEELIEGQRSLILDPHDPAVVDAALRNGIPPSVIDSAQNSPVYKYVIEWKIALPPHIEYRTFPMLFYVPPMSPVIANRQETGALESVSDNLFHDIVDSRVPLKFLANLFGAGQEGHLVYALKKQKAVRWYRRAVTVGDVPMELAHRMLKEADCTVEQAEAIYKLTTLCTFEQRFVIPPMQREKAMESLGDPFSEKAAAGFGFMAEPRRGVVMGPTISMLDAYAAILMYPESDHESKVRTCIAQIPDEQADVREMVGEYLTRIDPLSLSEMEELYIKTFDLNKTGTLDLGWHLFGEDYNRGLFLVKVRQYLQLLKIPETSELPDHVSQVLRVLGRMSRDEANQFAYACVIPSLETVAEGIQVENPHDQLIQGLIQLLKSLFEMPVGFDETIESPYAAPFGQLPVIQ